MNRSAFFGGGLLILIGLLLLLDSVGLFGDINIWNLIWPLFLISLGIWILLSYFVRSSPDLEQINIPAGSAEKAKVRFDHGAGRLVVKAGLGQNDIISGEFDGGVEYSADTNLEEADIRLKIPQHWFPFFWIPGASQGTSWQVSLRSNFPFSLSFNTGAGEAIIDLSKLVVEKLVVKTGASSTKITLPENAGYTNARMDAGVASIDVRIPESVSARIKTSVGLGSLMIDRKRFPKTGGIYSSPDYESAKNKVDLDISSGLGSINIH